MSSIGNKTTEERKASQADKLSAVERVVAVFRHIFIYLLCACILIAAIVFAVDASPQKSLFGYRYYTVLTPSMEPDLSVGDLVIVRLANADEIEVGDVITFNPSSESDAYLTHRVTEKIEDYEGTGVTCFHTKGDANDSEDGFLLDESRVIGIVTTHIPMLGYIIRFVQLRWYYVAVLVLLVFLFFQMLGVYFSTEEEQETEETQETMAGAATADGQLNRKDGNGLIRDGPADEASAETVSDRNESTGKKNR